MKKTDTTYGRAMAQTSFVAKFLGMFETPRSGATNFRKGDIFDEYSLAECKTSMTEKDSFTVKREWLTKMQRERFEDRKQFAFLVQNFGGSASKDNYVIMDLETFSTIYDGYKALIDAGEEKQFND